MKRIATILLLCTIVYARADLIVAPDFELFDIDDNLFCLDSLVARGPVLMTFWSLSCKMCIKELDALRPFYDEMDSLTVTILAVSQDKARSVPKVKPFVSSHNWNYTVVLDPENTMRDLYHVQAMPTSFIIDQNKNIILTHQGYKPGDEELIVNAIRGLFSEPEGCSPEE
jgi:peroxiredoxin